MEYFSNAIDNWNELGIWQDAEKLFYEREPGEAPKYTGHPNTQAVKNISNWHAEQRQEEIRQEQLVADPNYEEDIRHARSLSDLGIAGCKSTAAVHFSPSF